MQLGIFTFYVPGTVEETAQRIRAYGFDTVQLNLEFKDWRFEDDSSPAACQAVRETLRGHGLSIAAIAGYLNPIARDPARRRANLDRMKVMLERACYLGSPYVATETGSLHPHDDWAPHPDNGTPAAFEQSCEAVSELARHAAECGAVLLVEPAVGNVVDTPAKAQALMQQIGSSALGLVADPANCVDGGNLARADEVQRDMFARTAPYLKLAHAKDVRRIDGSPRERHHHMGDPALHGGMEYPSAGLGDLNYEFYLSEKKLAFFGSSNFGCHPGESRGP
ncbi:MAG: sugar phosphate isomerase/epimerase [Rhodospirillales bacterium]|nr:sugar phosphate isomerase/epimerase [Rhodospirillales bacterium]